jgi:hypothetical protein
LYIACLYIGHRVFPGNGNPRFLGYANSKFLEVSWMTSRREVEDFQYQTCLVEYLSLDQGCSLKSLFIAIFV